MIHVLARISALPEGVNVVRDTLMRLCAQSRQEAGCQAYDVFQQADDHCQFQTVERWTDDAAVAAHMASPHLAAAIGRAGALFAAPPQILRYEKLG